jgi:hypothetical protein
LREIDNLPPFSSSNEIRDFSKLLDDDRKAKKIARGGSKILQ